MIQQNQDKVVKHEVNHLDEFYLMYNKLNLHFREKKIKNIKSFFGKIHLEQHIWIFLVSLYYMDFHQKYHHDQE